MATSKQVIFPSNGNRAYDWKGEYSLPFFFRYFKVNQPFLFLKRDGKAIIKAYDSLMAENIEEQVQATFTPDALLMTDESKIYKNILSGYERQTVCKIRSV